VGYVRRDRFAKGGRALGRVWVGNGNGNGGGLVLLVNAEDLEGMFGRDVWEHVDPKSME
jgi:hypothetical protein